MADEGSYGSLAGMAAGAALGSAVPGIGTLIGAGLGGTAGGVIGGLFSKKPKMPDISGELAKISALFAQLRQSNTDSINYQAGQGRRAAASNLAARGIYSSPVSENTFNQLEGDRLRSISSSNAALAGQEAGMRSSLLNSLLGYSNDANLRNAQIDAARTGQLTGLSSSLLLSMLRNRGGGSQISSPSAYAPLANNYVMRPEDKLPAFLASLGIPQQ